MLVSSATEVNGRTLPAAGVELGP